MVLIIFLTSCSNASNNLNNINVDLNKIKFKDEVGNSLKSEYGIVFLDTTYLFIEWYNIYIDNPKDKRLKIISDEINRNLTENMGRKVSAQLLNTYELEMYRKYGELGREMITRALEDVRIEKELLVREKNLKILSDEEFKKLKENKEKHIVKIKEGIIDILDEYYDY